MSALPIQVSVTLEAESCCRCGVWFGVDANLRAELLRDRTRQFYCPNGHSQHYLGETEAQRLTKQLERTESNLRSEKWWHAHLEKSARAYRGQVTKLRKRIGNGVCPCRQRSFEDSRRHMASKHPAYAAPVESAKG